MRSTPMDLERQIRQKVGVPSQKEALSLVPRIQEHLISPDRSPKSTQYPDVLGARPLGGPRSLVDHYEDEDVEEPQKLMEEPQPKETKSPRRKKREQPQAD